jgi:hypothetical protein
MVETSTINLTEVAARWRVARRLYPIYALLARDHGLGDPCPEMESPINRADPEILRRIARWFDAMDGKVQAWQLRQVLQTTRLGTEENLRALLTRHLDQPVRSVPHRDKVDYLFVQYYAHCAPEDAHDAGITFEHVAEVLYHAVGEVKPILPPACDGIEPLLADLSACRDLGDLLEKKILDRVRGLKDAVGEDYFKPAVLVAFCRLNFILRTGFFRLMQEELHRIRRALHTMEARGQHACDCTAAGLAAEQPVAELRRMCQDWKKPFRAAYAAGQGFAGLVAIRTAVETAAAKPLPVPASPPVAAATAAPAPLPAKPASAPPTAPAPAASGLEHVLDRIAEQLLNVPPGTKAVSNVTLGQTRLLLASWEVAAFVRGGDDIADALQRAVAARALLSVAVEARQRGESADLRSVLGVAHAEAAQIQERIAEAKDARNIDAAVNLAATAKRLLSMIAESERA